MNAGPFWRGMRPSLPLALPTAAIGLTFGLPAAVITTATAGVGLIG